AQTIATPTGAVVTSSPAVSDGTVYFGSDDGFLYILRSEKSNSPAKQANRTSPRKSEVTSVGDLRYGWPSAFGGPTNANFIDDPSVKPPFRLRWATKCGGLFKQSVCATEEDVLYVTLSGLVVCREQMTGRIRWRRHLPGQAWCRSALLAADGKIFVPRMFSLRYPKSLGSQSMLYCLSGETGDIQWQAPIGIGDRLRNSPVYSNGVVAFGSLYKEGVPPTFFAGAEAIGQAIDAWDAATGKHCADGWRLYPTPGPQMKGVDAAGSADFHYYLWVDQFDILGLGAGVPIANGTTSDSLIALLPDTDEMVVLRVPYPLGFYTRGLDGRIDDPDAGWKGRGLWASNDTIANWHNEGGKGMTSEIVRFQIRPHPLAE
ncbi:MAG: PQQ-binding-like beta-propeller repeat protein, partial [Acidobacteria bacterium]|nr:PQQ-binding-like beta-propeller repeat protein [Acidobacteriota bacterium]